MSTIKSSDQSSVFSIYYSNKSRRNGYNTPQTGTSTPVSTAAKRPPKTQNLLKSLRAALSIFDDEIATLTDVRETAYETFVMAYKAAFTKLTIDREPRKLERINKILLNSPTYYANSAHFAVD